MANPNTVTLRVAREKLNPFRTYEALGKGGLVLMVWISRSVVTPGVDERRLGQCVRFWRGSKNLLVV